jgi:hypothetical protein
LNSWFDHQKLVHYANVSEEQLIIKVGFGSAGLIWKLMPQQSVWPQD